MTRVVIDTDGGIDDALALLLTLASPELSIDAITTVHGNVDLETASRNVFEVLRLARRAAPPVAPGASLPLEVPAVHATHVHGNDGLGGWMAHRPDPPSSLLPNPASELICSAARRSPGHITLLTLGPLTNAALALRHDPVAFAMLHRILVMGGAIEAPGNITPAAEFNLFADPHAAREVLSSGVPIRLVTLDATRQAALDPPALNALLSGLEAPYSDFLAHICTNVFNHYSSLIQRPVFYLHDPLAAALTARPGLATWRNISVDIETSGHITRGMSVADRREWATPHGSVEMAASIDVPAFLDLFSERIRAHGLPQ